RQLGSPGQFSTQPAVSGGKVYVPLYVAQYDPQTGSSYNKGFLYALDATTGATVWAYTYAGDSDGIYPRFKVAVDGGLVFTTNYQAGVLIAVNASNGTAVWWRPLTQRLLEHGAAVGGGRVYVPAGAINQATLIAFNQSTGTELWEQVLDSYQAPG